jgi:hypothetical protein
MNRLLKSRKTAVVLSVLLCFCITGPVAAVPKYTGLEIDNVTSTRQDALAFLNTIKELAPSPHWPNIRPAAFLQNIKDNVQQPIGIYPGSGTNFCSYGALTYLFLLDDPLGYTKLLIQLYQEGKAHFGRANFTASAGIKKQAGRLKYKGILDIHPAEQLWFLCLADHYKGYLNLFNRRYNRGDEDRIWAACNYAKFNRMVQSLLQYKVKARGGDLIRPHTNDLYQYLSEKMATGKVVLFINNRVVHKKNHVTLKVKVPTHFIVAERITLADDLITLVYWDYGGRTQLQMSPAFLKRIIFGITYCTKKQTDAN